MNCVPPHRLLRLVVALADPPPVVVARLRCHIPRHRPSIVKGIPRMALPPRTYTSPTTLFGILAHGDYPRNS